MPLSTLREYPRIGGVIGYGPVGGSGIWTLQERYALEDDFYDDVSLLLHMNGANGSTTFLDSSRFGHAVTANGNAQISTAQSKFGGASAAFDGNGDYLSAPSNAAFAFGTGDYTVEAWIYVTSINEVEENLLFAVDATGGFAFGFFGNAYPNTAVRNRAYIAARGVALDLTVSWRPSLNTWYHIAACRASGTARIFVDGTQIGSGTVTRNNAQGQAGIGRYPTVAGTDFAGYIDDLRITKGVALYTGSFTPPQRAFIP